MSESNPYETPEELAAASDERQGNGVVTRVIEYTISIVLIVALAGAFFLGVS